MTAAALPASLRSAIAALLEGRSRAELQAAYDHMSSEYRTGSGSDVSIGDERAAIAYVAARLPATYAAALRAMSLAADCLPGFDARTHLDLGAGPGTMAFAVRAVWPRVSRSVLVEPNPHFDLLGRRLTAELPGVSWLRTGIDWFLQEENADSFGAFDCVTLGYVVGELPPGVSVDLVRRLARLRSGLLVVVEPGTPQGFKHILGIRDAAQAQGGRIVAPCPHAAPCPLRSTDWCHFPVRLPRSAAHKAIKHADAPFEDEPMAFLAVAFDAALQIAPPSARLLTSPRIEKGFADLTLCGADGVRLEQRVPSRDKPRYKLAKHLAAGDMWPEA